MRVPDRRCVVRMPGDEKGACPCGHRDAMCHRANAGRYCPPTEREAQLSRLLRYWYSAQALGGVRADDPVQAETRAALGLGEAENRVA